MEKHGADPKRKQVEDCENGGCDVYPSSVKREQRHLD